MLAVQILGGKALRLPVEISTLAPEHEAEGCKTKLLTTIDSLVYVGLPQSLCQHTLEDSMWSAIMPDGFTIHGKQNILNASRGWSQGKGYLLEDHPVAAECLNIYKERKYNLNLFTREVQVTEE